MHKNLLIIDDKLIELNQQNLINNIIEIADFDGFNVGNIYLGKVERLIKELAVAFINIGDTKLGF